MKEDLEQYIGKGRLNLLGIPGSANGNFLVFREREAKPFLVLKIAREDNGAIQKEYETLQYLQTKERLRGSVPAPLFFTDIAGRAVLGETVLEGDMISKKHFKDAILWLVLLHKETGSSAGALAHGDFISHNVLSARSRIFVLDWAEAKVLANPIFDLFYFFTTSFLHKRRKAGIEGQRDTFERTFFQENKLVKSLIKEYCSEMGVEKKRLPRLFEQFLEYEANEREEPFWPQFLQFFRQKRTSFLS